MLICVGKCVVVLSPSNIYGAGSPISVYFRVSPISKFPLLRKFILPPLPMFISTDWNKDKALNELSCSNHPSINIVFPSNSHIFVRGSPMSIFTPEDVYSP